MKTQQIKLKKNTKSEYDNLKISELPQKESVAVAHLAEGQFFFQHETKETVEDSEWEHRPIMSVEPTRPILAK